MDWQRVLKKRRDINDDDIPEILERAIVHQSHVRNSQTGRVDINDIHRLAEELDIEEEFIDLAVEELRRERTQQEKIEQLNTQRRQKLFDRLFNSFSTSLGLGIGLLIVIVLGVLATRWIQSLPAPVREETIIQRTIIEAPVVVETNKSEVKKETLPPSLSTQDPPLEIVDEVPQKLEETVVKLVENPPVTVASLQSRLQGKWELKYYWLYEKGSDQPIVVPVTVEPLELPQSFSFDSNRYIRVMDRNLSFSATFEFRELPEKYRYSNLTGDWALLEASGVVATIGIRRPHDYFALNLDGDELTMWYLGAQFPTSKASQGEQYHRVE